MLRPYTADPLYPHLTANLVMQFDCREIQPYPYISTFHPAWNYTISQRN